MNKSRRQFIQRLTFSTAAIPLLSSWVSPAAHNTIVQDTSGSQKVLRVALMGLGGYAERVAEAMQHCKRAHIAGLISGTPAKLEKWGEKYKVPESSRYNYDNFDAIKDNPNIDAIYVITPNALHHNQVIRAAQAGKHVICEKPLAISAKEGQEMVDACLKAGVKLLVGYRMRFEPNTLEVVRLRQAGAFGRLKFFQGQCGFVAGDPAQWRLNKELAGGGSLMDIGIYAINGARYMLGEDPIWVAAQETKTDSVKFKEGVDETIQFELGFPSGAVASCLSSYNISHLDRFFLSGEKGFAEMWPSTGYGPIKGRTHQGDLGKPHTIHQTTQMDEMAAIIFDNKTPILPVDGLTGVQDLQIIEAIYKSCASGRRETIKLA